MHQIQSNSIEKCFWKLKEDAQLFSVGISPAGPLFPRGPASAQGLTRATAHGRARRPNGSRPVTSQPARPFPPLRERSRPRVKATWARAGKELSRMGQKKLGAVRIDFDRPIEIDGCAWISAEQKPPRRPASETLAHFFPSPRRLLLLHPERE
jgi:hypothetical protein